MDRCKFVRLLELRLPQTVSFSSLCPFWSAQARPSNTHSSDKTWFGSLWNYECLDLDDGEGENEIACIWSKTRSSGITWQRKLDLKKCSFAFTFFQYKSTTRKDQRAGRAETKHDLVVGELAYGHWTFPGKRKREFEGGKEAGRKDFPVEVKALELYSWDGNGVHLPRSSQLLFVQRQLGNLCIPAANG